MNKIIGVILILVGGFLVFKGATRKDSFVGGVAQVSTDVANKVDGGSRIPEHYYYIIGGALVVAAGIGMTVCGGRKC